jgi:trehalose 6-phosphate synthase
VTGERRKLIVVSNRGPVSYGRDEAGRRVARRGGGGLATALRSLVAHHDVTWIASAMTDEDRLVAAEAGRAAFEDVGRDGTSYRVRLVAHDPGMYERYYNQVANPTLWFVHHYLWDLARTPSFDRELQQAWDEGYAPINKAFAEAVLTELAIEPDAVVFFHDYHLYLAPRFVRDESEEAVLAHFVHVPWPQPDYWRVLPAEVREAIHDGLLANDLVGVHTRRWRDALLLSCEHILGAEHDDERLRYRGRETLVSARPISVDPSEFDQLVADERILARRRTLWQKRPELLVLRVDRTDPSKNILRGFRAFELYLESHPEMIGRVQMLALLDPSRQNIAEYAEYLEAIKTEARRVNERLSEEGWEPIDLRVEDDFLDSVAAYAEYDVLLVNAIYDGLNLVAKEAPLVNERAGVVVLSENAGAHDELAAWVITVNPFDVGGQADAIEAALEMSQTNREEHAREIREHVRRHDVSEWSTLLLADLDRATHTVCS